MDIQPPPHDQHMELQAIQITAQNGPINIINIYIPPHSSCNTGYAPSLNNLLLLDDTVILGDFNAHDEAWYSPLSDARGNLIADQINASTYACLNEDTPTRLPANGQPTSPDISIASASLLTSAEWYTVTALNSDHLPIIVKIATMPQTTPACHRSYINFTKANWTKFTSMTEKLFEEANNHTTNTNCSRLEKTFRHIINTVSKQCIPAGRFNHYKPCLPTEIRTLINRRNFTRQTNPQSADIARINAEINTAICKLKQERWREFSESLKYNDRKFWTTLKSLDGKPTAIPNCSIDFNGQPVTSNIAIANNFNKSFTTIHPHKSIRQMRQLTRNVKKRTIINCPIFTPEQILQAIRKAKNSKAIGPDSTSMIHLKHIGINGLSYIANMLNASIANCNIPAIWKASTIIPLQKPGKDPKVASSYRPISLLCPIVKILETLLLPAIVQCLPPAYHQHGFRPGHSTTSALINLSTTIANGLNEKKPPCRTIAVALDLTKAFDSVNHCTLINLINTAAPAYLSRWLSNYLKGRQSKTLFRNTLSQSRLIHAGVPQGSVISPALFNAYVSNIPDTPSNIHVISYADDFTVFASDPKIDRMVPPLNQYLDELSSFFTRRSLTLSATKSTVTLFTPHKQEANIHPPIRINNADLPLDKNPRILGIQFDTFYTFAKHARSTAKRTQHRNNILRALTGTTWGQNKETLSNTYKAICRPVINYGTPIWSPIISNTNWQHLQTAQNSALRIITGCLQMTPIDHLHQETMILPIRQHSKLLTDQYLAQCRNRHHPCHDLFNNPPPPPRPMKHTLFTYSNDRITATTSQMPANHTTKELIKLLHSKTVSETTAAYNLNPILNAVPPPINPAEQSLPRKTRCTLAQLRSGYSSTLNSYMNRINQTVIDSCNHCFSPHHTTQHLFNCPARPTTLTPIDLWANPVKAAQFLNI